MTRNGIEIPEAYHCIFKTEHHHNHEVVMDGNTICWKPNGLSNDLADEGISPAKMASCLLLMGLDLNSEVYRKFYRDLGISLAEYKNIFYNERINEDWQDYEPKQAKSDRDLLCGFISFLVTNGKMDVDQALEYDNASAFLRTPQTEEEREGVKARAMQVISAPANGGKTWGALRDSQQIKHPAPDYFPTVTESMDSMNDYAL